MIFQFMGISCMKHDIYYIKLVVGGRIGGNRQKAPPTLPSGKTNKVKSVYICIVKDTLNKHKVVKAKM